MTRLQIFSQQSKACGNRNDGFWLMEWICHVCKAEAGSTSQHPFVHFLYLKEILVHTKTFKQELLCLQIICDQCEIQPTGFWLRER